MYNHPIKKPGAVCGDISSFGQIFVSSLVDGKVYQVDVTTDSATLVGVVSPILDLAKDAIPSSLHWERNDNVLYIADASPQGGIVAFSSAADEVHTVLNNGSLSCQQVYDITSAGGTIMYTDQSACKLGRVMDGTGTYVTGMSTQQPKSVSGSQHCAAFSHSLGLCAEGRSVFLCDAAAGRLKLVTPVTGMTMYLEALYNVYKAFGTHSDREPTLDMAIHILMLQFVHLFGSNLRESLKRMTVCGFCYYTSRKSYYPCPQV